MNHCLSVNIRSYLLGYFLLLTPCLYSANSGNDLDVVPIGDPKGYLVYCPCMGK